MSVTITRIEVQKNNPDRISLFSEDQFVLGISKNTLIRFNLHAGTVLSDSEIQEISTAEKNLKLLNSAYNYLSRRQHSRFELKQKLIKKSNDKKSVESIMNTLSEKGFLDDKKFSEAFLQEELRLRRTGPLLIKSKLIKKGINSELIDAVIDQYNYEQQLGNCQYLAFKKVKSIQKDTKRKLIQFLRQKGYTWEIISETISDLNIGENDE